MQTISSGVATNYCVLLTQILPLLAPIICIYSRAFRHQLNLFPSLQCDQAHPDSSVSRLPNFFFAFSHGACTQANYPLASCTSNIYYYAFWCQLELIPCFLASVTIIAALFGVIFIYFPSLWHQLQLFPCFLAPLHFSKSSAPTIAFLAF